MLGQARVVTFPSWFETQSAEMSSPPDGPPATCQLARRREHPVHIDSGRRVAVQPVAVQSEHRAARGRPHSRLEARQARFTVVQEAYTPRIDDHSTIIDGQKSIHELHVRSEGARPLLQVDRDDHIRLEGLHA